MILRTAVIVFVVAALAIGQARNTDADIQVEREVTIAPKSGRAGATIGTVNVSTNIAMVKADVTIHLGPLPASVNDPLSLTVRGAFVMKNESPETLSLTVGFPVSNSQFSSFRLDAFKVRSGGDSRAVFNRITGYPRFLKDIPVSVPDAGDPLPPAKPQPGTGSPDLFGQERIGKERFQNLMVWQEVFNPSEARTIEVAYVLAVPLQKNSVTKRQAKGNYKGMWPQEANNLPLHFLRSLPGGEMFYFFDYYLTSGASWKGTIGEQTIRLEMDRSWSGHALYRHGGPEVTEGREELDTGMAYTYSLRDTEPTANLLFALRRPYP
jgi:hypothetical protein